MDINTVCLIQMYLVSLIIMCVPDIDTITCVPWHISYIQKARGFYEYLVREYGPVSGFYLGQQPEILITDLDILKEILVKDFNKFMDRPVSLLLGLRSK